MLKNGFSFLATVIFKGTKMALKDLGCGLIGFKVLYLRYDRAGPSVCDYSTHAGARKDPNFPGYFQVCTQNDSGPGSW